MQVYRARLRAARHWIEELEAEKITAEAALAALPIDRSQDTTIAVALGRLPDLSQALHDAPPTTKRRVFDTFDLRVVYDKIGQRLTITAFVTEAVADLLRKPADLQLCGGKLWGTGSSVRTTLTHDCALAA